jgi:regulator of sirC expression with transglutaminase-like and TPR domain
MIDEKELSNLIYLLDDTDEEVVEQVESKILSFGHEAISFLEQASLNEQEAVRLKRMNGIIRELKKTEILRDLQLWQRHESEDLLKGLLILERIEFPYTNVKEIYQQLDKIRLDAWLEFNYELTSFEQIKVLNYVFFKVHKFKGNTENYHGIQNSFISKVLENRTGNPVLLGVVYSLIAQRLNIPVFGVNLPQHFVLGYKSFEGLEIIKSFNEESSIPADDDSDIMFYINPFTDGLILNGESLRSFLKQLKIDPKPEYFSVCSNVEIIKRILRNLLFSYEKEKQLDKSAIVKKLLAGLDLPA